MIALCALPLAGAGAEAPPPASPSPNASAAPQFKAVVDGRGFIDVRQLQADVARVEPLQAEPPYQPGLREADRDPCTWPLEGAPSADFPGRLTPWVQAKIQTQKMQAELAQEAHARDAEACRAKLWAPYNAYQAAYRALNDAWLPALLKAAAAGDPVAEVILRQCSTTPVLDRSGIESTCDAAPERKKIAAARLKQIGFAPAFELTEEPGYWESGPGRAYSPRGREKLQYLIMGAIEQGGLGNIPYEATGCATGDRGFTHGSRLIEEARFRVRQAFTFSWTWNPADTLKLARQPIRAQELTWGPATLTSLPDRIYLDSIMFRTPQSATGGGHTPDVMRRLDKCLGVGLNFAETYQEVEALVRKEQASIDRYLKQDPRWGAFLMKRIGHHEWLPHDSEPEPSKLGAEWLGHWVLQESFEDFAPARVQHEGGADIYLDGATPRITIKTSVAEHDWPANLTGCTLRDSGAQTPPGQRGTIHDTVLGDLKQIAGSHGADYLGKGDNWLNRSTGLVYGLEPFEDGQRYRQVLMQCEGGEATGRETVRFLLLSRDTLVEVSTVVLHGAPVHVRHFRRAAAPDAAAASAVSGAAPGGGEERAEVLLRAIVGAVLVLGILGVIVRVIVRQRRAR